MHAVAAVHEERTVHAGHAVLPSEGAASEAAVHAGHAAHAVLPLIATASDVCDDAAAARKPSKRKQETREEVLDAPFWSRTPAARLRAVLNLCRDALGCWQLRCAFAVRPRRVGFRIQA